MIKNLDYGIGVIGAGHHLPDKFLSNDYVEKKAQVPLGTIEEKTGIKGRYILSEGELASDISVAAAKKALQNAGIQAPQIGLIICATFSGDYVFPSLAIKIQHMIGASNAGAFDVMANCTGFQVALSIASSYMLCDSSIEYALIVGTAIHSRFLDWNDIHSTMYLGDGSGAAVLKKVEKGFGYLSSQISSNGHAYDSVRLRGGGSQYPITNSNVEEGLQFIEINGYDVWKQVIKFQPQVIRQSLTKAELTVNDVDFFIFHQANVHLIKYIMARLKQDLSKTLINVDKFGNTAEASMVIALSEAIEKNLISKGQILVLSGVGAGFIFGSTIIRWS